MNKYYKNQNFVTRLIALSSVIIMAIALTSCSSSTVQPDIKIQKQTNVAAGDVKISVNVDKFNLSTSDKSQQGRIIYYIDTSVPTYYDHSAMSTAGTFAISNETSYTWSNVTPGEHKFSVQLVDNNNTPLPVPVVDNMIINVGAPSGSPIVSILKPGDGSSLAPGNILITLDVRNFIVSSKDMGVINREGEGHFIYYIDEIPPVDAGVPATTDTSVVSTDLRHLWKDIKEGKHTFYVQLVNNDDTPLKIPVVMSITIDVAA